MNIWWTISESLIVYGDELGAILKWNSSDDEEFGKSFLVVKNAEYIDLNGLSKAPRIELSFKEVFEMFKTIFEI